jgi:hypothetical protein
VAGMDRLTEVIRQKIEAKTGETGQWGEMVGRNVVLVAGRVYPLCPVADGSYNDGDAVYVIMNKAKTLAMVVGG